MASFYSEMEKIIAANGDRGLDVALFYYGLELSSYRQMKTDVMSKVHGPNAGGAVQKIKDFTGIIQSDDYSPSTGNIVTKFTSAYLYTKDTEILVGDEIRINSVDDKVRHYKIVDKDSIGLTKEIILRYKLTNLAEV